MEITKDNNIEIVEDIPEIEYQEELTKIRNRIEEGEYRIVRNVNSELMILESILMKEKNGVINLY